MVDTLVSLLEFDKMVEKKIGSTPKPITIGNYIAQNKENIKSNKKTLNKNSNSFRRRRNNDERLSRW